MQPVIINARWSCNGISVQYADFFSILVFRCLVKWHSMHNKNFFNMETSFKKNPDFVKKTFNYKFPEAINR